MVDYDWGFQPDKPKGLPPGTYKGIFMGYEDKPTSKGPAIKFAWKVVEGSHAGQYATCFADPPSVTPPMPANPLGRLLAGLAGREFTGGDRFDPKDVIGRPYMLMVAPGPKGGGVCVRAVTPA